MLNKVLLIGNVGSKDVKDTQNGARYALVSIATTKSWKNEHGERMEKTTWHNCNFFGKLAEIVEMYVHVGDRIYIEGEIHNTKLEDKFIHSINVKEMKMLGSKRPDNDSHPHGESAFTRNKARKENQNYNQQKQGDSFADLDDDIPF